MRDPAYALQAAVHAKLTASPAIKDLANADVPVHDKVVPAPSYPFIRIGDDQTVGIPASCGELSEVFATIHIFSHNATRPRPEVKFIANQVVQRLGDDSALPAPTGYEVGDAELEQSRSFMEADGITCHGVITIRFLVNATA